jgi:hypothetical protein
MKNSADFGSDARGDHEGWRPRQAKVASKMSNVELEAVSQRILPEVRNEDNCILSFRCSHGGRSERD